MSTAQALAIALSSTSKLAGAKVPIEAVVLHVDVVHHSATIRYSALETLPAGVRSVKIGDRKALHIMHAGEEFRGIADTSHTPWVISDVVETVRYLRK